MMPLEPVLHLSSVNFTTPKASPNRFSETLEMTAPTPGYRFARVLKLLRALGHIHWNATHEIGNGILKLRYAH